MLFLKTFKDVKILMRRTVNCVECLGFYRAYRERELGQRQAEESR